MSRCEALCTLRPRPVSRGLERSLPANYGACNSVTRLLRVSHLSWLKCSGWIGRPSGQCTVKMSKEPDYTLNLFTKRPLRLGADNT